MTLLPEYVGQDMTSESLQLPDHTVTIYRTSDAVSVLANEIIAIASAVSFWISVLIEYYRAQAI